MTYLKARTAWATVERCRENFEKEPGYNLALLLQVNLRTAKQYTKQLREKFHVVE